MTTALVILALIAVALIGRSFYVQWQDSYEGAQLRRREELSDKINACKRREARERASVNRAGEYEWQDTIATE